MKIYLLRIIYLYNGNNTMKIYLMGLGAVTVLYSLHVQYSKDMGNVWIRKNSDNEEEFTPMALLHLMVSPFKYWQFWMPNMWLVNYPLLVGTYTSLYYGINLSLIYI